MDTLLLVMDSFRTCLMLTFMSSPELQWPEKYDVLKVDTQVFGKRSANLFQLKSFVVVKYWQ